MKLPAKSKKKLKRFLLLQKEYAILKERIIEIKEEQTEIKVILEKSLKKEFKKTDKVLTEIGRKTIQILRWEKTGILSWKGVWDELYDEVNKKMRNTMDSIEDASIETNKYLKIRIISSFEMTSDIKGMIRRAWNKLKKLFAKVLLSLKSLRGSANKLASELV